MGDDQGDIDRGSERLYSIETSGKRGNCGSGNKDCLKEAVRII